MEKIQTVKIHDSEYDTTYTAHIQKNGDGWIGWHRCQFKDFQHFVEV